MSDKPELGEAEELELKVGIVAKLFSPNKRIYKDPEVQRRADTVFYMLCLFENDFQTFAKLRAGDATFRDISS